MIRSKQFPDSWKTKDLSEAVEFLDSLRVPVTQENRTEGDFPYYGANGLQGTIGDFIFNEPLVLLAEDGGHFGDPKKTIAYSIKGKTWVNNHAHVLRPKEGVDLNYLTRILEQYDVTPYITGSTRKKLTKAGASRIKISFPPGPNSLAEQKRIAAILDKADAIRRKRQQALQLTDDFLRSTFLKMFGDPVTNPMGWDIMKSGDVFSERPRIGTTTPARGEGNLVVRVGEIGQHEISFERCGRVELSEKEFDRYVLKKGDFVLARAIGSKKQLGKSSYYSSHCEPAVIDSHVMRMRVDPKICEPKWFYALMASEMGKSMLQKKGGATAVQFNINAKQASDLDIPIPPLHLQRSFVDMMDQVWRLKKQNGKSETQSTEIFKSLQQRAFSGQL